MIMKIIFIGVGNMVSSLVGGLIVKGIDLINIMLFDINE